MPGAMTFIPGSPRKVPGPVFLFLPVVMNHTITLLPCPIWTVGSFLSFLLPRSYLVPLSLGVETGFWLCVCNGRQVRGCRGRKRETVLYTWGCL